MALVTFESVSKACAAITAAGERPSIRKVIAHLGGGSPNAVNPLLNQWKTERPAVHALDLSLDPRIADAVNRALSDALAKAAETADQRIIDLQDDAEAVAAAGREAEARAEQLATELDASVKLSQKLQREREDAEAAAAIESKNLNQRISTLEEQLEKERGRADAAVQEVTKAQIRIEQIPGLEAEIERLKPFEKMSAVLEAKLGAAESNVSDLRARLEASETQAAKSAEAAASAARDANTQRIAAEAAQAHLDSASREIATYKDDLKAARDDLKSTREELKESRKFEREAQAKIEAMRPEKPAK